MRSLLHTYPGLVGALIGLTASYLLVDLELNVSDHHEATRSVVATDDMPIFADRLDYAGTLVATLAPQEGDSVVATVKPPVETVLAAAPVLPPPPTVSTTVEDPPPASEAPPASTALPVPPNGVTTPPVAEPHPSKIPSSPGAAVAGWLGTPENVIESRGAAQAALVETSALPQANEARPGRSRRGASIRTNAQPAAAADEKTSPLTARVILEPPKDGGCVWLLHNGETRLVCS